MAYQKGAFQVSMGFIIAVVFAVIMLVLAIGWLQGMFPGITQLTNQVSDIARQRLLDELAAGGKVSIAAPAVTAWGRGQTGSFALGMRNDDPSTSKTFYINIELDTLGGELSGQPLASYATQSEAWLTYSKSLFLDPSAQGTVDIIIRPATTANVGIYVFKAYVCDSGTAATCDENAAQRGELYGTATFSLEIKS